MIIPLNPSDKKLRIECRDLDKKELRSSDCQNLIENMLSYVYGNNNKGQGRNLLKPTTIGLSANQIGFNKRLCIVDLAVRNKKYNDIHVMINPRILWYSRSKIYRREGCVNLKNIFGIVERSRMIDVEFLDRWGSEYKMRARGWISVLIQHEVDHLNGKLFIDRLEDPKKAHLVEDKDLEEYSEKYNDWKKFIDITKIAKRII